MTVFQNKEVVRCLMEAAWSRGEVRVIPILVDPDYVGHLPIGGHYSPEGVRIDIAAYRAAFPDLEVTLDDLIAKGDKVIRRFTLCGTHRRPFLDIPSTGKRVTLRGIAIDRLVGGYPVESWVHVDRLAQERESAGLPCHRVESPS